MQKKNKKENSFDVLVQNLVEAFQKIPNIDLVSTDSAANKMFNTIIFRLSDMSSFRDLVIHHYIPATNKAIAMAKSEISKSRYASLLHISREDYQESFYQTVRLAYVGLFHKLESFINDISQLGDLFIENNGQETVEKYAKRRFNFSLKDWQLFNASHKVNWVANCVKHYDGFPKKTPRPLFCEHFKEDKRLVLTVDEFKRDSDYLLQLSPTYIQLYLGMAMLKSEEMNFDRNEWSDIPQVIADHDASIEAAAEKIQLIFQRLKALAAGEEIENKPQ